MDRLNVKALEMYTEPQYSRRPDLLSKLPRTASILLVLWSIVRQHHTNLRVLIPLLDPRHTPLRLRWVHVHAHLLERHPFSAMDQITVVCAIPVEVNPPVVHRRPCEDVDVAREMPGGVDDVQAPGRTEIECVREEPERRPARGAEEACLVPRELREGLRRDVGRVARRGVKQRARSASCEVRRPHELRDAGVVDGGGVEPALARCNSDVLVMPRSKIKVSGREARRRRALIVDVSSVCPGLSDSGTRLIETWI